MPKRAKGMVVHSMAGATGLISGFITDLIRRRQITERIVLQILFAIRNSLNTRFPNCLPDGQEHLAEPGQAAPQLKNSQDYSPPRGASPGFECSTGRPGTLRRVGLVRIHNPKRERGISGNNAQNAKTQSLTYEAVDLMGSDPFITAVEGKKSPFLASTTVSRGSDPIISTLCYVSGCDVGKYATSKLTLRVIIKSTVMLSAANKTGEQTS